MTKAQAIRYGRRLEVAGLLAHPGTEAKLPKALRNSHGPAGITGWSTATDHHVFLVCVDVAKAVLSEGWTIAALRACTWRLGGHVTQ